jgi:hypothetical protein
VRVPLMVVVQSALSSSARRKVSHRSGRTHSLYWADGC